MTGSIVLNGCGLANIGTYSCTLTATVNSKTATSNFTIIIQDPCKRAIFDAVNPFSLITVSMPTAGPTTSNPAVLTDLSPAPNSITCNWTGVISPTKAWIAYNSTTKVITITHGSITLPTELGTHSFSITVDSTLWPSNVVDKVYTFDVLITCNVATLNIVQQAANKNPMYINDPAFTTMSLDVT